MLVLSDTQPLEDAMKFAFSFVAKFSCLIVTVLNCFDRVIFKGPLPFWTDKQVNDFVDFTLNIKRKDFLPLLEQHAQRLVDHAQAIADQPGRPYLREDDHFVVVFWERYPAREDPDVIVRALVRRLETFRVPVVAADGGGNGSVYNNLLLHALPQLLGLYAIYYSQSDQAPRQYKGRLGNWTIGRTASIGMVFTRIKKQRIRLPRLEDSRAFVDEIWCEVAEYDDQQRSIKYTHPETQPDDTLHALNYAAIAARRGLESQVY